MTTLFDSNVKNLCRRCGKRVTLGGWHNSGYCFGCYMYLKRKKEV